MDEDVKLPDGMNADIPTDYLKRPGVRKYKIRFYFGEGYFGMTAATDHPIMKDIVERAWEKSKELARKQFGELASFYTRYEIKELD